MGGGTEDSMEEAKEELDGRELMIDMGNVIVVSQEAENTLLQMMNEGARFRCSGVLRSMYSSNSGSESRRRPVRPDTDDQRGQK